MNLKLPHFLLLLLLPLWYIPTGVLFDLLCAEPERPWNLTVHFRGYPRDILIPCEGKDSVKWSFINSLKEAAYIINGNCKNIMNMSQSDQVELWLSVMNVEDEYIEKMNLSSKTQEATGDTDMAGQPKTGKCFTLHDAVKTLLPEFFFYKPLISEESPKVEGEDKTEISSEDVSKIKGVDNLCEHVKSSSTTRNAEIKLVRIQGIEPKLEIPFSWVVNNLMNPDHFLHVCVCVKVPEVNTT